MLVLARAPNDEMVIVTPDGTEILVKVVDVRGKRVRLGFEAPAEFKVYRWEVWEAIKRENLTLAQAVERTKQGVTADA